MTLNGDWSYPTSLRVGAGRINELPQHTKAIGLTRPLVVTDKVLAGLPLFEQACAPLKAARVPFEVFTDVRANPTAAAVAAGILALQAGDHDGVIAIGGGSALDCGKIIAFMINQTRPIWDFEDVGDWWTRASTTGILPVIAVPTTAGTGSEVGRAGVITDARTYTKKVIFHPLMMPKVAICDPELTVGMPTEITIGTGMDAFSHCLEAYCGIGWHPMADGIALEGMRLVREALPQVLRDPTNLEARTLMMAAASMGAAAFQKALGAVHALSHPVGSLHGTHHGMTNATFLPYVLAFNRPAIEDKIARAAAWLGLRGDFNAFMDFVLSFRASLNVPHTLVALGVSNPDVDQIAYMATVDPNAAGNPVPLDETAAKTLIYHALIGTMPG